MKRSYLLGEMELCFWRADDELRKDQSSQDKSEGRILGSSAAIKRADENRLSVVIQ